MRLAEVIALLDAWFPPSWAEPWDRVGLVCGDPEAEVERVLLAVDPVGVVTSEAISWQADLLLVHHPLFLSPVSSVAATTPKGRVVHELVRGGVALFTAHTNADVATGGTNDALARALGLMDPRVVEATDEPGLDKLVVFSPGDAAESVRRALADAGAGAVGAYDSCSFTSSGHGRFRPLPGADPTIGAVGDLETVDEVRIETVLPRSRRAAVVAALREAHPYEEPAFDILEMALGPGSGTGEGPRPARGHGRVGELPEPVTLREFAEKVATALPGTAHGVRVAGDPDRSVSRVAVGAGSGDGLLERVRRTGADVYVTSDLKHHRASEFLEEPGPAIIDVAHWAAEWLWLPDLARRLDEAAARAGARLETSVSTTVTDPWTFRASQPPAPGAP